MTTPEGRVKDALLREVKKLGGYGFKCEFSAQRGCPDWLILLPKQGKSAFFELKSENGSLSPFQIHIIDLMRQSGIPVYVVYNKQQISDALQELLCQKS